MWMSTERRMMQYTIPYFTTRPDRELVDGEHDLETLLAGEAEADAGSFIASVEVFGFHVIDELTTITVHPDGYVRPVATFDYGEYDDVNAFLADAYSWRLEFDAMDHETRKREFGLITHDLEKADKPGYCYLETDPVGGSETRDPSEPTPEIEFSYE